MRSASFIGATGALLFAAGIVAAQEISQTQIERGRYLTAAANCLGCHTDMDHGGPDFAGGRELETPFGVIISPNITFDMATGIGAWSRDDFWNALHNGERADGAQLYPAMPYPYFTRMPRQDVDAIFEYLRTIPPVEAEHRPEAELPAPLRIRAAVRVWKALNFTPGEFQPDPERSDEWNRGAYLVDGPAHCGACHTGKTLTGGDDDSEYLRGGVLENWLAPNIRGGENGGIADWSEDDIVAFLGTGRAEHTIAMERMGEIVVLSTQHLTDGDLRAIATYLKSLDDEARPAADAPGEAAARAGEAIYFDNCAACHKSDGGGVPEVFARLDGSNKINSEDPTTVIRVILDGAQAVATNAHPGPFAMPAFGWKLTDEQVADLVSYLRSAWGNNASPISASDVADLREALLD